MRCEKAKQAGAGGCELVCVSVDVCCYVVQVRMCQLECAGCKDTREKIDVGHPVLVTTFAYMLAQVHMHTHAHTLTAYMLVYKSLGANMDITMRAQELVFNIRQARILPRLAGKNSFCDRASNKTSYSPSL